MAEVLLPLAADPTVSFSVSFAAGSQDDPPGKEGLAGLTASMLGEAATRTNSYDEILEALYPLATGYDVSVDREMTALTGRVHRDKLEVFTELFVAAFTEPAFAASDFERIRSDAINYLESTLRYSSDEELAKAVLYSKIFAGTRYAHPEDGTLAGLKSITLDDVRDFYRDRYTRANTTIGLTGCFDHALVERLRTAVATLPEGERRTPPAVAATGSSVNRLVVVDKPGADASISFGFPIDVHRGEKDFYALWIANSWLGEHRNSSSHLYQVIRERRGLNYGDYSYIECFPDGGSLQMPPVNVPRRHQLFEVWVRTVPVAAAAFALKAAVRELDKLRARGLDEERFELTRAFLGKYSAHFAPAPGDRLGYAVDDRFYAFGDATLPDEGHLARFARMMKALTLADVNAAIERHLSGQPITIAIVADGAADLVAQLTSDAPAPISYESEMAAEILAEDREIAGYPLEVAVDAVETIKLDEVFAD